MRVCVARARIEPADGGTILRHAIDGEAFEGYEEIWRERIEPGHDRVIEALFDKIRGDSPDRYEASKQRS
jgi:hypothetical protein